MPTDELEASFQPDPREPLGFTSQKVPAADALAGIRLVSFRFSSRGDRVPGRLRLPMKDAAPYPLVLLEHGAGGAKDASYLDTTAAPWVRAGAAVASIDLPLHGERRSAKLSELLLGALREPASRDALRSNLLVDFARQAVIDLRRCLDALLPLPEIDAQRVVFAGFSLGAIVGATFCAFDHRPRAAALALAGGGNGPAAADPIRFIDRCRSTKLLFVGANADETIPRSATQALFDAAPEPKELLWFDGTHGQLPGIALKAMWEFLRGHLD
jgi:dienelactone hydrolase